MHGVQQCAPYIYIYISIQRLHIPHIQRSTRWEKIYIARFRYLALEYNMYTQVTFKYTTNTTMKTYYTLQSIRIHIQALPRPWPPNTNRLSTTKVLP